MRSQQKGARLLHHNVKNSMAEASAGISLYMADHPDDHSESMHMLQAAGEKLRQALRMTWRANQISSIFEGAYKPQSEPVDLHEWVTASGPKNVDVCGVSGHFVLKEPVVAEMFLAVSFDNVTAHAGPSATVVFSAAFANGSLCMDISNGTDTRPPAALDSGVSSCPAAPSLSVVQQPAPRLSPTPVASSTVTFSRGVNNVFCAISGNGSLPSAVTAAPFAACARARSRARARATCCVAPEPSKAQSGALTPVGAGGSSFSTGLGLNDLREISKLRGIYFESAFSEVDSLWHSVIKIPATQGIVGAVEQATKEQEQDASSTPPISRIAIIDDLPLNAKMAKIQLKRHIPGVIVEIFLLNTTAAHDHFVRTSAPAESQAWDLVIMDYCLEMEDDPQNSRYGTDLLDMLRAGGCRGCFVMNSGNNTEADVALYKSHGATGSVGKGTETLAREVIALHRKFHRDRA